MGDGNSWNREVVQSTKGYGFIRPSGGGGRGVFAHISAVGRASLNPLGEAHTVGCGIASNRGKEPAVNLKAKPLFCQLNQRSLPPQNVDARIDGERALWQILKEHDARLISNTQRAGPSAQTRTMTAIEYKGYRIEVSPVGKDGEHLSFRRVRPVHGQIVRPFLKKVARRRLLPRPNALSKHA